MSQGLGRSSVSPVSVVKGESEATVVFQPCLEIFRSSKQEATPPHRTMMLAGWDSSVAHVLLGQHTR